MIGSGSTATTAAAAIAPAVKLGVLAPVGAGMETGEGGADEVEESEEEEEEEVAEEEETGVVSDRRKTIGVSTGGRNKPGADGDASADAHVGTNPGSVGDDAGEQQSGIEDTGRCKDGNRDEDRGEGGGDEDSAPLPLDLLSEEEEEEEDEEEDDSYNFDVVDEDSDPLPLDLLSEQEEDEGDGSDNFGDGDNDDGDEVEEV